MRGHTAVHADAKAIIKKVSDELGMKEIAVASRIYLWFAEQDDVIQKGVLKLLPKGYEADVCKLALERLASGKSSKK